MEQEDNKLKKYIIDHWRGNHPLWQSFFINFWLIGIILNTLTEIFISSFKGLNPNFNSQDLLTLQISLFIILIFSLAIVIWQFVGLWRSASKAYMAGQKIWAVCTKTLTILSVISVIFSLKFLFINTDLTKQVPYLKNIFNNFSISSSEDNHAIIFSGVIEPGSHEKLSKYISQNPKIKIITLNSHKGDIEEAWQIAALIEQHNLSTTTTDQCLEACFIPYIAGKKRFIGEDATLGLAIYTYLNLVNEDPFYDHQKELEYLLSHSINIIDAYRILEGKAGSYPSHAQLYNMGIITEFDQ